MGGASITSQRPGVGRLEPSATLAMNELAGRLQAAGRQIYRLGFGQSPFPVPDAVVDELRSSAHEKDYLPTRGLPALRSAIADHFRREFGVEAAADDVLIGPGSKELMFLLQLALDADLILPAPCWVSYAPQARMLDRPIHLLPTRADDQWQIDPEALTEVCRMDPDRARLLVMTDPSNPTGTAHSKSRQREITEVARAHGIVCLSDEIYAGLTFAGNHSSMAIEYPEGTIVSSGLSKWCGAGGWRLGTFVFPKELRWLSDRVAMLASETFSAVSAPVQHAAVRAYEGGETIEEYRFHVTRILAGLADRVVAMLTGAEIPVVRPVGGFYVFPDFGTRSSRLRERGITTSRDLCNRLLEETGVALLPGHDFNMAPESLTARLAFVDIDGGPALEAAMQPARSGPLTDEYFEDHADRTLTGVELLLAWLDD